MGRAFGVNMFAGHTGRVVAPSLIVSAAGANQRVFTVQGTAGDSKIEGLTIMRGYLPASTTDSVSQMGKSSR